MAVAQKDHTSPHSPRMFSRAELVEHVRKLVPEVVQVVCVQESCGFGFVLHRELMAAGDPSFLITPISLNGRRNTDKLDARALCLRLSRWLDGNRDVERREAQGETSESAVGTSTDSWLARAQDS